MSGENEVDEGDEYDEGEGDEMDDRDEEECEEDDGEDEGEDDVNAFEGGSPRSPGDGRTRPFILPAIWTVNNFKLTMTTTIFKNLRDRCRIP